MNTVVDPISQKAWDEFLQNVRQRVSEVSCRFDAHPLKNEEEPWFRGEGDGTRSPLPSLFRSFADADGKQKKLVRDVECDLFYEFAARARQIHGEAMSDWDILFTMQHHGTPTRLLDWTEALAVAVYFAIEMAPAAAIEAALAKEHGKKCTDEAEKVPNSAAIPRVWILNPYRLNQRHPWHGDIIEPEFLGWKQTGKTIHEGHYWTYGEIVADAEPFKWDWPTAIYPRQKTDRMHNQRGWFTIHGNKHVAFDAVPQEQGSFHRAYQDLPLIAIPAAWHFLELAGINRYTIYPDLPGLSEWLKRKYRLCKEDGKFSDEPTKRS